MTSPTGISSDLDPRANPPASTGDYAVLWALLFGTFVVLINETIMVNAIPRLMTEFSVSARSAQWLSTIFMLTMAVVIPATGWLLARVPTRAAFTGAMSVFGVGHAGGRRGPRLRGAAGRARHPGHGSGGDDAAPHDHADEGRARARPGPGDGEGDHDDLDRTRPGADGVRTDPARVVLALAVRTRTAGCRAHRVPGAPPDDQPRRADQWADRLVQRGRRGSWLRGPGLRGEPARRRLGSRVPRRLSPSQPQRS